MIVKWYRTHRIMNSQPSQWRQTLWWRCGRRGRRYCCSGSTTTIDIILHKLAESRAQSLHAINTMMYKSQNNSLHSHSWHSLSLEPVYADNINAGAAKAELQKWLNRPHAYSAQTEARKCEQFNLRNHDCESLQPEMWQLTIGTELKAGRGDTIANLKCFLGLRDTSDLNSMFLFTFTMRRHLLRLASAPFTSYRMAKFGGLRFPCATPGNIAEHKINGGRVKTPVLF